MSSEGGAASVGPQRPVSWGRGWGAELHGLLVAVDWALCPYQVLSSGGSGHTDTLPYTCLQGSLSQASQGKISNLVDSGQGVRSHLSGDFFTLSPHISFRPLPPPRPSSPVSLSGPELRPPQTAEIPGKAEEEKVGTALWQSPSGPRGSREIRKGAGAHRRPDPQHPAASGRGVPGGGPRAPAPPTPGSYLR